jgi:glycosyltransferase involved in cell wall biosynthesis
VSRPIRIVMMTGSYPPDACGVGGYTARLTQELRTLGAHVDVYNQGPWGLGEASRIAREIRERHPDVTHIQYPTVGFNRSLGPQLTALKLDRVVTTIHEVSQVHWLRRVSLYPFSLGSRALLFSNQFDRDYAAKFAPWIAGKTHLVPLGSSIPQFTSRSERDPHDIICFGLIRPQKGVEEFIQAAAESKRRGLPFTFTLIGMQDPRFADYFKSLLKSAEGLSVRWEMGLDDAAVASRLSRAAFAYMAYPDGATERRTSMIALLAQGLAVVTTASAMTPDIFKTEMTIASSPADAVEKIAKLAIEPTALQATVEKGLTLACRFEWPAIARRHLEIYESIRT